MDETLVFSTKTLIKCSNSDLLVFIVSLRNLQGCQAKIYIYKQEIMPICSWVIYQPYNLRVGKQKEGEEVEEYAVVIQGKMGYNHTLRLAVQADIQVEHIKKYQTHIHGFCRMSPINLTGSIRNKQANTDRLILVSEYLLGVCQDSKSVVIFNTVTGSIAYRCKFENQSICQSITYIQVNDNSPEGDIDVYLAQQGCKVHKLQLDKQQLLQNQLNQQQQHEEYSRKYKKQRQASESEIYWSYIRQHINKNREDTEETLQQRQSYQLKSNKQIKIINSMQLVKHRLFCLLRKTASLYILSTVPKIFTLVVLSCALQVPRNLILQTQSCQGNIMCKFVMTDGNIIHRATVTQNLPQKQQAIKQSGRERVQVNNNIKIQTAKIGQLQQSKNIEYMEVYSQKTAVCGCSGQKQFFYLQIN